MHRCSPLGTTAIGCAARVREPEDAVLSRRQRIRLVDQARVELESGAPRLHCSGPWIAPGVVEAERALRTLRMPDGAVEIDLSDVTALDLTGAWLLHRTGSALRQHGREVRVTGATESRQKLLDLVAERGGDPRPPPRADEPGVLEDIGRASQTQVQNYLRFLSFIGQLTWLAVRILLTPAVMYWKTVVREIEEAGFQALPIVGLLTFLIGVVISYQGGQLLRDYGGSIFIADLVGFAMLRELSPLITAIIVAGRTGSAYTAQIGTMQVTEEVDALRSMGIAPIELLVLPKLIALLVALPLLTVFADIMGVVGGMLMAEAQLDVSYASFIDRLKQAIDLSSLMVGIGKAPVFAAIIASVGCYQGFRVSGGAEAVGRRTTICVVQSIFLVIVVDAVFSILFNELGI
jgi:phospholipid/cholesterol/gamma-HCH transport system permease protein